MSYIIVNYGAEKIVRLPRKPGFARSIPGFSRDSDSGLVFWDGLKSVPLPVETSGAPVTINPPGQYRTRPQTVEQKLAKVDHHF